MYYIAIGASAGGQSALCEFFDHLDPALDAAYFVSTHLLRSKRSHLDEILQRHTAMTVLRVDQRMRILPKMVYVQPENASLTFEDEFVSITVRSEIEIVNRTIDHTLGSLSLAFRSQVIAVILSGSGSDGTSGVLTISAHGGKIIVQDPDSSEFQGMPGSAIASDHPAAVCKPSGLADKIKEIVWKCK